MIRAKANRTVAYLRLKQLLEIPASQPVTVSAELDDATLDPPSRFAAQLSAVTAVSAGRTAAGRVPGQQAASAVQAREAAFRITKAQRRPLRHEEQLDQLRHTCQLAAGNLGCG